MTSGGKRLRPEEVDALLEKLCTQTKAEYLHAKNKLLYKNKMNSNGNFSKNETFMACEPSPVRNFDSDKSPTKDILSSPDKNCSPVSTSSVESSFEVLKSSSSSNNNNESNSKVIVQMLPNCGNLLSEDIKLNEDYQKILESRKCIYDSTTKILKSHYNQFTHPVCSPSSHENFSSSFEENDELSDDQSNSSLSSDEGSPNSSQIEIEYSEIEISSGSKEDKDMDMNSCNINSKENHFLRNGKKLKDIDCIASQLVEFTDNSIKALHYILFGNYGAEYSHEEQIEKILQFNGFDFNEESEVYKKKRSCLFKLPYPLLSQLHKLFLKSIPENRLDAVEAVLNYLLEPSDAVHEKSDFSERLESTYEMEKLKKAAMQTQPVILIKKLDPSFIRKMLKQETCTEDLDKQTTTTYIYRKPSFIHQGNGVLLKNIPDVVNQIKYVPKKILYLLHSLLYGRPGNVHFCKENILEFSGYSIDQKGFVARGKMILEKMRLKEIKQLCDLFSLRARNLTRDKKIKILLDFLQSPTKCQKKSRGAQRNKKISAFDDSRKSYYGGSFSRKYEEPVKPTKKSNKLRDFETICSNVECSTPEDLNELNDLLYVKPCDSSEIHQKILDFTPFKFDMHSFEINYRKTLLHYMDFAIIKKIARILNIEDFEYFNNKQDLIMKILTFLMEMKLPDKKSKSSLDGQNRSHVRPHILKIHSYHNINIQNTRSHQPENFDSTYGSEEIFEQECEMDSSRSIYHSSPKSSFSRLRHRKNGLSAKQEQILFDSTPLLNFLYHPTERELTSQIKDIIDSNCTSISMGDLVKEVLNSYPDMNLYYRIDFIRNKALELLQEMRDQALTLID